MQYALVKGIRTEPIKGEKGYCEGCNSELIAKCGNIKLHHWAHKSIANCDAWWESETEWHREWKSHFPIGWREVIFRDKESNEIHRADIHTPNGVTIEFQNSPISYQELQSRNSFYQKIIWVVNAAAFDIQTSCYIPDPRSPLLDDFIFEVDDNGFGRHLLFSRKYDPVKNPFGRDRIFGVNDIELRDAVRYLDYSSGKYRIVTWKYKRMVWLETIKPVFLDFGHDDLYWLRSRHQSPTALRYIQVVSKSDFLKKYTQ